VSGHFEPFLQCSGLRLSKPYLQCGFRLFELFLLSLSSRKESNVIGSNFYNFVVCDFLSPFYNDAFSPFYNVVVCDAFGPFYNVMVFSKLAITFVSSGLFGYNLVNLSK
jgi:hypothetical protein